MSKGKIITFILAATALICLGVIGGCSYLNSHSAEIHKTVGMVLEIAYTSGGAATVEQKIDAMVTEGKITPEQAVALKAAAKQSYDALQKKLAELAVKDVQVKVTE